MDRSIRVGSISLTLWCTVRHRYRAIAGHWLLLFATGAVADGFVFQPAGCEYAVTFPEKPRFEMYEVPFETYTCVSHVGWIQSAGNTSALKAECTVCAGKARISPPTKAEILSTLKENALQSGVDDAVFSYHDSQSGPVGVYRGVIKGVGNTFVSVWHYGAQSGLVLVGSAPYARFHELHFDEFIATVIRSPATDP